MIIFHRGRINKKLPGPNTKRAKQQLPDKFCLQLLTFSFQLLAVLIGTAGFEPATSRPPGARATKLRHVPSAVRVLLKKKYYRKIPGFWPLFSKRGMYLKQMETKRLRPISGRKVGRK